MENTSLLCLVKEVCAVTFAGVDFVWDMPRYGGIVFENLCKEKPARKITIPCESWSNDACELRGEALDNVTAFSRGMITLDKYSSPLRSCECANRELSNLFGRIVLYFSCVIDAFFSIERGLSILFCVGDVDFVVYEGSTCWKFSVISLQNARKIGKTI